MSLVVKHGKLLRGLVYGVAALFCLIGVVVVEDQFHRQLGVFQDSQAALLRQHSVAAFERVQEQLDGHRLQPALLSGLELNLNGGCLEEPARVFLQGWTQLRSQGLRAATQRVQAWPESGIASPQAPRLSVVDGTLQLTSHIDLGRACAGGERLVLETRTESHALTLARPMPSLAADLVLHVALQPGAQPAQFFDIVFHGEQAEYRPSATAFTPPAELEPGLALVSEGRFQMVLVDEATGLRAVYRSEPLGQDGLQRYLRFNARELALILGITLALLGVLGFLLHTIGLSERLHRLSTRDFLTGLYNRRAALELAGAERARALRSGRGFCVLQLDIDHFKRVNDSFGHDAGDIVLQFFAECLRGVLREQDLLARMGGEEFLVLLPETDLLGARQMAERLRYVLHTTAASYGQQHIAVTCSLGLTAWRGVDDDLPALLKRADQLLYQAKQQGRDRCVDDQSAADTRAV
ncbi:diguanylate cyclase [Pseudomonas sp.]|uniref:GGDEF domain-containing protein n=1 Tax=Pseudomonas sp. TaxID=306 RepID=UPI003C75DF9E